jgi:hypothetical protein
MSRLKPRAYKNLLHLYAARADGHGIMTCMSATGGTMSGSAAAQPPSVSLSCEARPGRVIVTARPLLLSREDWLVVAVALFFGVSGVGMLGAIPGVVREFKHLPEQLLAAALLLLLGPTALLLGWIGARSALRGPGRRTVVFEIAGNSLIISETGVPKRLTLTRDKIIDVDVYTGPGLLGQTGTVLRVRIDPGTPGADPIALHYLRGWPAEQVRWFVDRVREALGLAPAEA